MSLVKILRFILSIPKTILFNFRVFPFKVALKLPILIAYNLKIANASKGSFVTNSEIKTFMIKINWDKGSEGINHSLSKSGYLDVKKTGKIVFEGKANFSIGTSIRVDDGVLSFGENFSCNRHCSFSCNKSITFKDNVLLGWNVNIRDSDGHHVFNIDAPNIATNTPRKVEVGNHVWLTANVDILKGVKVPDNCIVGFNSCVTREFEEKNCIITGYPAKIIKRDILWEK